MTTKVYLSPSDQWSNKCSGGDTEAGHCKKIAESAKKYLTASGYEVKIGDNRKEGSYSNRVTESNNWSADVHVAIHTNAGGGEGTEVFCYPSSKNNKYVKAVYNAVAKASKGGDRGIKTSESLYEIKNTEAVCVYVEAEFHDTNGPWIDDNVSKLGKAIAQGICDADGNTLKSPSSTTSSSTSTSSTKLWKVQCGAYESQTYAEKQVKALKKAGFDAFAYKSGKFYKVQCGAFEKKSNAVALAKKLGAKRFDTYVYQD